MKIRTELNNQKMLYPLTTPLVRFIVRLLDAIITGIISFIIYKLVNLSNNFDITILLTIILSYGVFAIYYLIIPYLTKGYTLFRYIFKIKLIELINIRKYLLHLVVHDLFIWIHFSTLTLIYVIVVVNLPQNHQQLLQNLFNSQSSFEVINVVFRILYSLAAIVSIAFLVYSFLRKGKRNLQDLMSWTAVISLSRPTPENIDAKLNPSGWDPKPKYHLPGEIDATALRNISKD